MVKWIDPPLTEGGQTSLLERTHEWSHTLRFLLLTNIPSHFKKTLYIYLFVIYFSANSEQHLILVTCL
jgi:hypothetical protein